MYTCTHTPTHPSIHPCMQAQMSMNTYTFTFTYTYDICIYTYIYIYICICICTYIYIYRYIYIYTHTPICNMHSITENTKYTCCSLRFGNRESCFHLKIELEAIKCELHLRLAGSGGVTYETLYE